MAAIKLLAMDSDGVLTDGGVYINEEGSEFRRFDIKDGLGIRRVLDACIPVVILSASNNRAVLKRAQGLGIKNIYLGVKDKLAQLQVICDELRVTLDAVCFIGDDLTDLPVLHAVGLACSPADAVPEVLTAADYVCQHPGGHGAVREVCDLFLEINA